MFAGKRDIAHLFTGTADKFLDKNKKIRNAWTYNVKIGIDNCRWQDSVLGTLFSVCFPDIEIGHQVANVT